MGSMDAAKKIIASEGVKGLYRGYGATLASFGPFSALYFLFYERCKNVGVGSDRIASESAVETFFRSVVCASMSGAAAAWITSPLDMIKLRLQVQRGTKVADGKQKLPWPEYSGIRDAAVRIVKQEGFTKLYTGAWARVALTVPTTALTFGFVEMLKPKFQAMLNDAG